MMAYALILTAMLNGTPVRGGQIEDGPFETVAACETQAKVFLALWRGIETVEYRCEAR